jgi:dimethylamine corrinoid protein
MPVVVLGLCKGAIHDTGKNVVKICLEANGFKVIDVGKCAEPLSFALAAANNKARVVGISIPVTTSIPFIKKTITLIRKRSPKSKIVIGGCAIDEEWVSLLGVDGYAPNAESAVKLFKRLCT